MAIIKEELSNTIKETKRKIDLLNLSNLARSINISINHIHLTLRGDSKISYKIAYDIAESTNNFITMDEVIEFSEYTFKKKQGDKN